jgi:hypothetical protein
MTQLNHQITQTDKKALGNVFYDFVSQMTNDIVAPRITGILIECDDNLIKAMMNNF